MRINSILAAVSLLAAVPCFAQKGNIGFVYPSGVQRGTTVEVTVGGQNLSSAKSIVFSGSGVSGELIPSEKKARTRLTWLFVIS